MVCINRGSSVRAAAVFSFFLALLLGASADAETLTVERAIAMALTANADVRAAAMTGAEADARRRAARAGWFPRIDIQEGWQRGNQPVFVFGSLLGQRRFSEGDFAIRALNRPDPLNNFQASLGVSQPLFDGGRTLAASRAASAAASLSLAAGRQTSADVAVAVVQAYTQVIVADAGAEAAAAAIDAATADAAHARARRDAGLVTDADVLSLNVHVAQVRVRRISAATDAQIARATLNRLIGAPLEEQWELVAPAPLGADTPDARTLETEALQMRPDVVSARLRVEAARADVLAARALTLPHVGFEGGYEWNGAAWSGRAPSWVVGVRGQLSLNVAGAERSGEKAAARALERARIEQAGTESIARVDVRAAAARLEAARAHREVGRAAVAEAREGERIIRDRYAAGMTGITDVLRAANAVLDAVVLDIGAASDERTAAANLERAVGRLPGGGPQETRAGRAP